ncbi:ComEC/Rec2 family competence protein [Candidatus Microgenomates bacterium]|nr:ComEC/Rec2 family competence protein [Candidatus Microgenomates bacterium]
MLVIRKNRLAWLALALAALNIGLWRGQTVAMSFQPLLKHYEQKITVAGQVIDDTIAAGRFQTEFHIAKLQFFESGQWLPTAGGLQIRGFPKNKLNRGDLVEVSGKLLPTLGRYQGQINFAEVKIIGKKTSWLESIRRRFFAGVNTALPEPESSLGLGFLVGARNLLPDELTNQLATTGLTHIVAVSGYNLTILVRFTRRWFGKISKYWATASSVALIAGFLAVTGISPSIFRAAIVSGLALGAWYYGRPLKPMVLILVAAAVTAGANPTYLWQDIGWYLSFLAFFGVLVIAPLIMARIYKHDKPNSMVQILLETSAAQIMTLPLIIYIFGKASLVALPANAIILPIIPLAMLLTLIAGVGGMWLPALAGCQLWPAHALLSLMTYVISWFSKLPMATTAVKITSWQLVVLYVIIGLTVLLLRRAIRAPLKPYSPVE